jgi:N-acetylglutamate synthase-like GNAT family acetyltransferase
VSLFQDGTEFQFRKLAVAADMQHAGIGSSLVNYVIAFAEENGGTRIWCNARLEATGFYLKQGFGQTGNLFTRKGIDYEIVEKMLTPASNHTK